MTESGPSSAAYIYSDKTGFYRIEDMKRARFIHGCSVINDSRVLVAGGRSENAPELSTEYLDLTSLTWSDGPELPKDVSSAQMLGPEVLGPEIGGHLIKGEEKIFKLEKEGLSQEVGWAKVGVMKHGGKWARAFCCESKDVLLES